MEDKPKSDEHCFPNLHFYNDEFVFDKVTGMFYRLSPSAGFLLRSLTKDTNTEDLIDMVREKYGVDRLQAVRDVELFLNDLSALGILHLSDFELPAQGEE